MKFLKETYKRKKQQKKIKFNRKKYKDDFKKIK